MYHINSVKLFGFRFSVEDTLYEITEPGLFSIYCIDNYFTDDKLLEFWLIFDVEKNRYNPIAEFYGVKDESWYESKVEEYLLRRPESLTKLISFSKKVLAP